MTGYHQKEPSWWTAPADWFEWWHGIGSDRRYNPKWWFMRRAYMAGLQDAARIIEQDSWDRTAMPHKRLLPTKFLVQKIHERYRQFADEE